MPTRRPLLHCARFALLATAALTLAACGSRARDAQPVPPGVASITGRIASVQLPSVLVVAESPQPGGSDRAALRVHAGTRVLWASGAPASPGDLRKGQLVRAWFDGPVMESYPVQASAGAVVIDSPP